MTEENHKESIWRRFKSLFGGKQQETVRETIEDLIEEANSEGDCPFSEHEQLLLNNILYLKDKKCCHAMIPRANIIAFHKRNGSRTCRIDGNPRALPHTDLRRFS